MNDINLGYQKFIKNCKIYYKTDFINIIQKRLSAFDKQDKMLSLLLVMNNINLSYQEFIKNCKIYYKTYFINIKKRKFLGVIMIASIFQIFIIL